MRGKTPLPVKAEIVPGQLQLLGVLVEGRFDSPFRGQPSPLDEAARRAQAERDKAAAGQEAGGAAAVPDTGKPESVLG